MNQSIWTQDSYLPHFDRLRGDIKTDVLIIGGGICGLLCALALDKAGIDYCLVEGKTIASGITRNTTAKITSQHGLIYDRLIRTFGKELAEMYLKANQKALDDYKKLCSSIDCDFEICSAYTYSIRDREKIETEVKAVNSLGFPANFDEFTELPLKIQGAICFPDQALFHPLKFIEAIIQKLKIFEHTYIQTILGMTAVSQYGKISADHIIIATHFPFINRHGAYFMKLYQHRSYVSAYDRIPKLSGIYVDEDEKGLSFRNSGNHMLIGSGGHRTGKKGTCWSGAEAFTTRYYPQAVLQCRWAAQDCMSLDAIPYIGRYAKKTPQLYVATGFNKWGMTSSMVAANILCDLVQGRKNAFADVFSPQRRVLRPQLFLNGCETAANFLTPTVRRCSHMGCALRWNKNEHTWDCSCHGSRFTDDGAVIDNPATKRADVSRRYNAKNEQ